MRTRNLLLPLALIAIGALILLANLGVLSSQALQRLVDLWPLLLIIVGIQLVLNHFLPRPQATAIGIGVTAVIVAGAIAYAALAPVPAEGTQRVTSSQPIGGLNAGILDLNYSAASVTLQATDTGTDLYRATINYPGGENPPTVSVDQQTGTVSIGENGNFGGLHFFGTNNRKLEIKLTSRIPWSIRLSGGASSLHFDLRQGQVRNIEVEGGASSVDGQLGPAKGTVDVKISGGASSVSLHLPSGSQWNVALDGGVSSATIDGQNSGALGSVSKHSSGYTGAADRFDISVNGGVSHLDLHTK
jgi:Domain of unknown function (DUF5668)